jgi:hypothetical protein
MDVLGFKQASKDAKLTCRFKDGTAIQLHGNVMKVELTVPPNTGTRPVRLLADLQSNVSCIGIDLCISEPGRRILAGGYVRWTMQVITPFHMEVALWDAIDSARQHSACPWPYGVAQEQQHVLKVRVQFAPDPWPRCDDWPSEHPPQPYVSVSTLPGIPAGACVSGTGMISCRADCDAAMWRLSTVRCMQSERCMQSFCPQSRPGDLHIVSQDGWTFLVPNRMLKEPMEPVAMTQRRVVPIAAPAAIVASVVWLAVSHAPVWDPNIAVNVLTALSTVACPQAMRALGCHEALIALRDSVQFMRPNFETMYPHVSRAAEIVARIMQGDKEMQAVAFRLADLFRQHIVAAAAA